MPSLTKQHLHSRADTGAQQFLSGTNSKFRNAVSGGRAAMFEMKSSSPAAKGLGSFPSCLLESLRGASRLALLHQP